MDFFLAVGLPMLCMIVGIVIAALFLPMWAFVAATIVLVFVGVIAVAANCVPRL